MMGGSCSGGYGKAGWNKVEKEFETSFGQKKVISYFARVFQERQILRGFVILGKKCRT